MVLRLSATLPIIMHAEKDHVIRKMIIHKISIDIMRVDAYIKSRFDLQALAIGY